MGIASLSRLVAAPVYARFPLAIATLSRRFTWRRFINLLIVESEYRLRRTRVAGKPHVLFVDPANICNLRCPLCSTGLQTRTGRPGFMTLDQFKAVTTPAAPTALKVNLYTWGESLLNPQIFGMIDHCRSLNLTSHLSSNLSLALTDDQIDALVRSGLDYLCVSIDGTDQHSYETYRKKGELALVLDNVRRIMARRSALKRRLTIEWQFIIMRHNEHQLEQARSMAAELGFDVFRAIPVGPPYGMEEDPDLARQWFPEAHRDRNSTMRQSGLYQRTCYALYRYGVVTSDLKLSPCSYMSGPNALYDDLTKTPMVEARNNEKFRAARSLFRKGPRPAIKTGCETCHMFKTVAQ